MRPVLLAFFLSLAAPLLAQKLLSGLVLDAEKGSPVPKASVFLNNTSVGTTADDEGRFRLSVPAGRYELIVSSVGYATQNTPVSGADEPDFLTVRLKPKAPDLEAVVIEPYEKDGWEKWGSWFIENFLGTSEYGRDSRIQNPEVLKFRHSKKDGELRVRAVAPLVVENSALGYRITYQLENFSYSFRTRYLLYAGYPFFEELPGSDRRKRRWEREREDVYHGSMLHFMRAVYRNRIGPEGFEMRRLQKLPNTEKARVRALHDRGSRPPPGEVLRLTVSRDSTAYYNRVFAEDDWINVVGRNLLPGDSVAYAADSVTAGLFFPDYLLVTYKPKPVSPDYKRLFPRAGNDRTSELTLPNGREIRIQANGAYLSPEDILSTGYWAWWEKMGTMLPFDYRPPKR